MILANFEVKASVEQIKELKEHLFFNGYCKNWNSSDSFSVIRDYAVDVETILSDRDISYICTFKDEE